MVELVFSIYIIVVSLVLIYQSYARVIADSLPYLSITGGSTESVILVVLNNTAMKWGIVFGFIGLVFIILSLIVKKKDNTIETSTTSTLIIMIIVWTLLLLGCVL